MVAETNAVKVGDRVKTKGPYSFDPTTGEVVRLDHGLVKVKIEDGNVWSYINSEVELLPIAEATDTTESQPVPFTIEAGKYYRTRDGRKVGPMKEEGAGSFVWLGTSQSSGLEAYRNDGSWSLDVNKPDCRDLIAEWVEVPATEPTNGNTPPVALTEPRRFKVGDKVRALVNWAWVKAGQEYVVDELDRDGDVWLNHSEHGQAYMTDDELELIAAAEETLKDTSADGRIVMDVTNGVLTMEAANIGEITIEAAEITEAIKSTLLRTKQGYGFEIARHGDYVWVDTGRKAPLVFKAADVQAAA